MKLTNKIYKDNYYLEYNFRYFNHFFGVEYFIKTSLLMTSLGASIFHENNFIDRPLNPENIHLIEEIKNNELFKKDFEVARKLYEEAMNKVSQKHVDDVFEDYKRNEITSYENKLNPNALIDIELCIERFYGNTNYAIIYLKVGQNKKYIVKDALKFLYAIKEKQTLKYGKTFEFNHKYSNFTEYGKKVIDFLFNLGTEDFCERSIRVFPNSIVELLYNNDVKTIKYKDEKIYLFDNNLEIKSSINDNFILNSNLKDYDTIIPGFRHILLIDSINKKYSFINNLNNYDSYVNLIKKLENKSIKNNINRFNKYIYPKYKDDFNINENIKEYFKTSELIIESYFDMEYDQISLKTIYKKEDKEIKIEDINNPLDLILLEKYQDFKEIIKINSLNIIKDQIDVLNFLKMDLSPFKDITKIYLSENLKQKQIINFSSPTIKINYNNGILDVLNETSKYSDEELFEILKAIKKHKKFYILKNNSILALDNEEASNYLNTVEELNLDKTNLSNKQQVALYSAFKNFDNKIVKLDDFIINIIKEISKFKKAQFELPKLKADYRKYQIEGFNWLKILNKYKLGGILADDMGLGKTLEVIMLLESLKEEMPSLIVCPKSLIFNWVSEFKKFESQIEVFGIYGESENRKRIIENIDNNKKAIYIISYDSLRNDINLFDNKKFNYQIIDEGQYIKNSDALKSISTKSINANLKLALTGTPIENNILELWSIFDYIMPSYLGNIHDFKEKYENNDDFTSLRKKITPFILRRTKKEVLKDLPLKYEHIISCELNEEQRKIYDATKLEANIALSIKGGLFTVLGYLNRLRQICIDPSTYLENYYGGSEKINLLMEIVKDRIQNGHKILIFSQFVKALDIIKKYLNKENVSFLTLTGETQANKRLDLVNQFNENENIKVFLISLKAGGSGLNLIGADTIIHLDPWWNVAVENQATDRAHRIGQTRNVEVIKLICENTIEQKVIELQNIKKDLVDRLISNDDQEISKLNEEDIKFILN